MSTKEKVLGRWTIDFRAIAGTAITFAVAVGIDGLLQHRPSAESEVIARGMVKDTRIVADHALETKWGGQLTWRAQYKVEYSVSGKDYFACADSGIRGESQDEVKIALPRSTPVCRVRYRRQSPQAAIAECR